MSIAVLISLVISLTTTPMMCAWLLRPPGAEHRPGRFARAAERGFDWVQRSYVKQLDWALGSRRMVMLLLVSVIVLNWYLISIIPKGFFPQQDSSQLMGGLQADQSISFQAMSTKLKNIMDVIRKDPGVSTVVGFTGGTRAGGGFMFVDLKPLAERKEAGSVIIARLKPQLAQISGVSVFLNPVQDLRIGGRSSNATYQYTLKGDDAALLKTWAVKLSEQLKTLPQLTDVNTDQQANGVESFVTIDRDTASRFGITPRAIDNALYNAFGQRTASTIYEDINQYSVILATALRYREGPLAFGDVYVPAGSAATGGTTASDSAATGDAATRTDSASTTTAANPALRDPSTGSALATTTAQMVPLAALTTISERAAATSINHQDATLATTISFNLETGTSLSDAQLLVKQAEADISMPIGISASFQGQAKQFQESQNQQPLLILAAIVVIYIVLGVLYESYAHPVTVLSTLPSAGVGAVIALLLLNMEFSLIALIGLFLLIGIVKKNAILIIDFALDAERSRGLTALEAVREACVLRFRPILMTTLAAVLGALPLAIGYGEGSELRRPLGVAIIGGLIASQMLTLLTTPVVYVYMDKLRRRRPDEAKLSRHLNDPQEV
jgi:multidrug efflux pump